MKFYVLEVYSSLKRENAAFYFYFVLDCNILCYEFHFINKTNYIFFPYSCPIMVMSHQQQGQVSGKDKNYKVPVIKIGW